MKFLLIATTLCGVTMGQRWRTRTITNFPTVPEPTQEPAPEPQPTEVLNPNETQTLYGQCGGENWEGPVACPTGAYCKNDGNIWYSQCVSIAANPPSDPDEPIPDEPIPDDPNVVTRTLTTIFGIPGPTPTQITTAITYITSIVSLTQEAIATETVTVVYTPDDPVRR